MRVGILLCIFLAFSPSALARLVEVTVTVLDPHGIPIPDARVTIAAISKWSPSLDDEHPIRTDSNGVARAKIETPDVPQAVIRAFISDLPPVTSWDELVDELRSRRHRRSFDPLGYYTIVSETDSRASIVATANETIVVPSVMSGDDAENVTTLHLMISPPQSVVPAQVMHWPLPADRALDLYVQTKNGRGFVIAPVGPLTQATERFEIEVNAPDRTGHFTGLVEGAEELNDVVILLSAIRSDGRFATPLPVRPNGRFVSGDDTADPATPAEDLVLATGEYLVVADSGLSIEPRVLLRAMRENTAQAERDALIRFTISEGQRTVVKWDASEVIATTDALLKAVLHNPGPTPE